jgi:hypothetical protein
MTTVLAVYNSDGCVGRCDAKCHDASTPDCDCICGGRNHGVGHTRAVTNTRAMLVERADATAQLDTLHGFAIRNGLDPATLQVHAELPLFV